MAPAHTGYAPSLVTLLNSDLHLEALIETAVSLLKCRRICDVEPCALATTHVLSQVVKKSKWTDADQLLDRVYQVGRKMVDAQPEELVIGNIVRRVLSLIRDEVMAIRDEENDADTDMADSIADLRVTAEVSALETSSATSPASVAATAVAAAAAVIVSTATVDSSATTPRLSRQPTMPASTNSIQSIFNLLSAVDTSAPGSGDISTTGSGASTPIQSALQIHASTSSLNSRIGALRGEIIEGISEIRDEIGQADDQIAGFAENQIRPGDYVLVYEPSRTVEKFLIKAAARRHFTVFLVRRTGHCFNDTASPSSSKNRYASLLKRLGAAKVDIIHIHGSAVAAYMSKVNRVVLDVRSIAAGGGAMMDGGNGRIARAAHAHGRTVIVLGGVHKLSPETWTDPEAFMAWGDPGALVPFSDGAMVNNMYFERAVTEYVPPELIDLYVTNLGPHDRDHLEIVASDYYKNEDFDLYGF